MSKKPSRDYSDRTGFPGGAEAMRGAAREFEVPRDFRVPELLRPWQDGQPAKRRPRLHPYEGPAEELPEVAPPVEDVAGR